ncbi:MAG: DUF2256 domain-containing protein [Planctomycetota bacterium]
MPSHSSRTKPRPEKICPVCQRPFQWRKKWARDWDNVKYCSQRCRSRASSTSPPAGASRGKLKS